MTLKQHIASQFRDAFFNDDWQSLPTTDAAVELDRTALRMVARESLCRLWLGRLAARLLARRAYNALGFARLSDYCFERLGISSRELQTAAQVWRAVCFVPQLKNAFCNGQLNWTKLRLLARVVNQESAEYWIETAATSTTRELAQAITLAIQTKGAGANAAAGTVIDDDPDLIDGEPAVVVTVRCPRRVRPLWRELAELASRVEGAPIERWRALQAICFEAASAAQTGTSDPNKLRGLKLDKKNYRDDNSCGGGQENRTCPASDDLDQHCPNPDLFDNLDLTDEDLEIDSLCASELEEAVRSVLQIMSETGGQLGSVLLSLQEARLYRHIGYSTMADYVRERLGFSETKARMLVRLERDRHKGHGRLAEAYKSGRLSAIRTIALSPLASQANIKAWIERAEQVTVRRLFDEVRWAFDMRDRSGALVQLDPPPLGGHLEFSDEEADRQMRAHCGEAEAARLRKRREKGLQRPVILRFIGPASLISLFCDLLEAYRDPADPNEPAWRAFERILLHARKVWLSGPRHKNPIHERDGWRCRVPACSSRQNLQEHHVVFRSRGGGNQRENRVSICAWHHLRGIHAGRVTASGDADGVIHWKLGGQLRFNNDAYC